MWTLNPVTKQLEQVFQGKLVSVSQNVLTNANANQTAFRVASVQIPNGKIVSCRIYEKNYAYGMNTGESYRCVATQYKDSSGAIKIDILMSHLTQADRATLEDFGVVSEEVTSTAKKLASQAI